MTNREPWSCSIVTGVNSPLLAPVKDGFRFFSEWADIVVEEGILEHSNAVSTNNTAEYSVYTV